MNQNTSLHICILLCICSSQICLCIFEKYEKCAPLPCGNVPNVSYPFYILDKQPSYCGQPGFNLTCNNNRLHLSILSNTFQVLQIFYQNRSVLVSDAGFLNIAQTCIPPIRNLTLQGIRFNFTTGQEHTVALYSDCPKKLSLPPNTNSFKLNCSNSRNTKASIFAVFKDDPNAEYALNGCKKFVWTRLLEKLSDGLGVDNWKTYEDSVRKGLVLNWKATNCSHCRLSGGRCGFDEVDYRFWCYCTDRAHAFTCPRSSGNYNSPFLFIYFYYNS